MKKIIKTLSQIVLIIALISSVSPSQFGCYQIEIPDELKRRH